MQLGMIGAGRMGANIVRRLLRAGHDCVAYDVDPTAVAELVADGARGAATVDELVAALEPPRAVWAMVPAGITGHVVTDVASRLSPGDAVIDGANGYYGDSIARAAVLAEDGIAHLDVGVSGGVFGLARGFSLMIGGDAAAVERLAPIFRDLAPGVDSAERTPGRTGAPAPAEEGWLHCGGPGAGHLVKMVHNGIEYGMMAAVAEGLNILDHAGIAVGRPDDDPEIAPLKGPERFRYDLDLAEITEVWRRGSVVSSWLVDLTAAALHADPDLAGYQGRVADSGEGRWTVQTAVELGVPAHVIAGSLFARFSSRGESDYGDRVLSAMRHQFGGHVEHPVTGPPT
ncbi:phosphogluconate dehydrogenase (NAD(+)-dependent, decarboxylating) [Actinomarinicola tropica]|uniref:Decarboxylating 6-phosphogluconate dehydrogenase n=1 Tax=Actinomarinicola tropica TaxID=2789776 RepID=A0A5Q2RHV2_9ACTN|nr:decarboxylating 6-phosphogluconate dehydrogenase [Actinomarinicola tropica]QGG94472.1 decarboxylating 6-phosphogluconate dehydrogenase [Actinomarinicola tropica]